MTIMTMLTLLVSNSIRSAIRNKKKLEARIASEVLLYDCLRVLKTDLEKAFHYQHFFFEMERMALDKLSKEKNNPKVKTIRQTILSKQLPARLTQFLGDSDNVHFTTLNHFRTRYNARESDQMEVGYYLEKCKSREGDRTSQCLWRRSSTRIDDKVDKGGGEQVMAENVVHFKLSYRSRQPNDKWVENWRSDGQGKEEHRNRFPSFVKVDLKIGNEDVPEVKTVEQSMVVQIQFPNNEPPLNTGRPTRQRGG